MFIPWDIFIFILYWLQKNKGNNKRPTRNQDANNGIANLSTDADISADLDDLLLEGPVEM